MPTLKTIGAKTKEQTNQSWSWNDPFIHSHQWRKVRKLKIQQDPLCEVCMREGKTVAATVGDHHRPRRLWPELNLTMSNLVSMCQSHHRKKSLLERDCQTRTAWELTIQTNELYKR
jgi:5-methylcytosine-specific restriction endonuclease McrA